MITPSFGLTSTERVLPRLALDFTTASLDPRVTFTRTANTATVINSIGDVVPINADLPRFDFDPITLACRGLLIEEARTNLLTYSEQFNNAVWSKLQSSVSADAVISPDGTQNADSIIEDGTLNAHQIAIVSFSFTSGTSYTISTFAKPNGRNLRLGFGSAAFTTAQLVIFNLTTGTGTVNTGTPAFTITPYKDGWYRCSVTATATATAASSIQLVLLNGTSATYQGDGTSGVYLWGAQLEAGAFPTSYIPTETTAVTRNADVATMTGTNFSDWFNASEGAFFCEFTSFNANTRSVILLSDNSAANRMYFRYSSGGSLQFTSIISSVNEVTITPSGTSTINTVYQPCAAYKLNSYSYAINGTSRGTDDTANVPTLTQMSIGANFNSTAEFLCGHIRQFNYYPQRLTNAEVVAFSK